MKTEKSILNHYRSQATRAAKDLGYGAEVCRKIKNAKSCSEIEKIMTDARHEHFK